MSSRNIEVESPVSAARLFKAAFLDWHKVGPQLVPEIIASAAIVEGEACTVGSVMQLNYTRGMPISYVKERLDFVDFDKFECKTTILEVGHLGTKLESESESKSASAHTTTHEKYEPTSSGGCVYKLVVTNNKTIGAEEEGEQAKARELDIGQFKVVEAYLLANPTAYA